MTRGQGCRTTALAVAVLSILPLSAPHAESACAGHPCLQLEYGFYLRGDSLFASNTAGRTANRLFIDEGELRAGLAFNDWLSFQATVKSEPVREARVGRSSAFFGQGVFLQELYVNVDAGAVEAFAGKLNPTFGVAWSHLLTPGIFAKTFAEDYETTEMIGFGIRLKGDWRQDGLGNHHLTGQMFFQDNSFLHTSILTRPKFGQSTTERPSDTARSQGGLANTGKPNSFSVTLDGGGFEFAPMLNYHLGYRRLHRSAQEERNEQAFAIGFDHRIVLGNESGGSKVVLLPLLELVQFVDFEGSPGKATYGSAGTKIEVGSWIVSPALGLRRVYDLPDLPAASDRFATVTVEYRLDELWTFGVGYQYLSTRDIDSGRRIRDHIIGLRLALHGEKAWTLK